MLDYKYLSIVVQPTTKLNLSFKYLQSNVINSLKKEKSGPGAL